MLPTSDCRTQDECRRYHDDLTDFLRKEKTITDLGHECISAISSLQLDLYDKQDKFAGYRRHGIKNGMSAMTTSPAENQVGRTKQSGVNAKVNLDKAMKVAMTRCQSNLSRKHADAHMELVLSNYASRCPTSKYVSTRGQALIDRYHDRSFNLKSAQTSTSKWITWNNYAVDSEDLRDSLSQSITQIMRVSRLELWQDGDGTWFVKCDCGKRENSGVPCDCYSRIAVNAGVPESEIIHLSMLDPIHLNTWETHYGTSGEIGRLLYRAQAKAFEDEHKGIRIPANTAQRLLQLNSSMYTPVRSHEDFPRVGPHTSTSDFREAQYMMSLKSCTKTDLQAYRSGTNATQDMTSDTNIIHGGVDGPLESTPFRGYGELSTRASRLLARAKDHNVSSTHTSASVRTCFNTPPSHGNQSSTTAAPLYAESCLTTPVGKKMGQLPTKVTQRMHSALNKKMDDAKQSLLKDFGELAKHCELGEDARRGLENDLSDMISEFKSKARKRIADQATERTSGKSKGSSIDFACYVNDDEARELETQVEDCMRSFAGHVGKKPSQSVFNPESVIGEVDLCRNEHPSYISPTLNKRFRSVYEPRKKNKQRDHGNKLH